MEGGQRQRPDQRSTKRPQPGPTEASSKKNERVSEPVRERPGARARHGAPGHTVPPGGEAVGVELVPEEGTGTRVFQRIQEVANKPREGLTGSLETEPRVIPGGAAHRMSDAQAEKPSLDQAELEEVAEDLKANAEGWTDAAINLEKAGMRARAALEADERKEREGADTDWRGQLLEPARQLLGGLDKLQGDEKLWERVEASEKAMAEFDQSQKLVLYQVLDLNVDGLLNAMGLEEGLARRLGYGLRTALDDLLEEKPDKARQAVATKSAQQQTAYVTNRLRSVIDDADPKGAEADRGLDAGLTRPERLRAGLRDAMRTAAEAAVPAALAAGAVSLFFPADHTTPIVLAAAGVAAKEWLKQAVQLAATRLLGRSFGTGKAATDPAKRVQSAKTRLDTTLSQYVNRLSDLGDTTDPSHERLTEPLRIKCMSAVYELLQAQLDYAPAGHDATRRATKPLLDSLRETRNLIGTPDHRPDGLAATATALKAHLQMLREDLLRT